MCANTRVTTRFLPHGHHLLSTCSPPALHPISTQSPPYLHPISTRSPINHQPISTRSPPDLHPISHSRCVPHTFRHSKQLYSTCTTRSRVDVEVPSGAYQSQGSARGLSDSFVRSVSLAASTSASSWRSPSLNSPLGATRTLSAARPRTCRGLASP